LGKKNKLFQKTSLRVIFEKCFPVLVSKSKKFFQGFAAI